jgi:hypothetical protein
MRVNVWWQTCAGEGLSCVFYFNARPLHSGYCNTVTPASIPCKTFTQWLLQHSDSNAYSMQTLYTVVTAAQWLPRKSMQGFYRVVYAAAQWLPRLFHARTLHSGLYCSTVTPASIPCKAFTQWLLQHSDSRAYSMQSLYTVVTAAQCFQRLFHARPLHSGTVTPASIQCKAFTQWLLQHSDSRTYSKPDLYTVVTAAQWILRHFHAWPLHSGLNCCTVTPSPIPCKAFTQWLLQHIVTPAPIPCKAFYTVVTAAQWLPRPHARPLHSGYCSTVTPAPVQCKAFTQWLLQHSDSRAYSIKGLCVSDPYSLDTDP